MNLRVSSTGRALLLSPTIALLCGDSFAPGGCGGSQPADQDRRGALTCTMKLDGADLACAGEYSYSGVSRTYTVVATGGTGTPRVTYRLPVSLKDSRTGSDLDLATGLAGLATAVTEAGAYEAAPIFGGGSGTARLGRLEPPLGSFHGVLTPSSLESTATRGPAGTTVALEVAFEALQ